MNLFVDGDQGSRSQMVGNLEELRARGQAVIESLSAIQLETLLEVQKRLSALNGRRQRAFRVPSPDLAARFLVSDFLGTDQAKTTGIPRLNTSVRRWLDTTLLCEHRIDGNGFNSAVRL
jgi:hypothetical protein